MRIVLALEQRGAALPIAVLVAAAMMGIAAQFYQNTNADREVLALSILERRADLLADSAINRAIAGLIDPYHSWPATKEAVSWKFGENSVAIRFENESAKISLNNSSFELLQSALDYLELDEERAATIAGKIVEHRESLQNSDNSSPTLGDTNSEVFSLQLGEDAFDDEAESESALENPFRTINDLRSVEGIDDDVFRLLEPHVTIHSQREVPDLTLAEPIIEAIVSNPIDVNVAASPFESSPDLFADEIQNDEINQNFTLDPFSLDGNGQESTFADVVGLIESPKHIRVIVDIELPEGFTRRTSAVVRIDSESYRIVDWKNAVSIDTVEIK